MAQPARRLASLAFAAAIAFASAGAHPGPAAAAEVTISSAEQQMVGILNADRAAAGLIAFRVDARLSSIARARSVDMATKHYFSHTQPDGRSVFDILTARTIKWYSAGEIIAWNTWPTLAESARAANDGWLGSATHRSIVMATSYNYMGVGLAIDGAGKKVWTTVFLQGPDRTAAWVALNPIVQPDVVSVATTAYRTVRISWRGDDVTLVVRTAGLRNYQVQRRVDRGAWRWLTTWTTRSSRSIGVYAGHRYDVRVRACDRAGNCGRWAMVTLRG